MPAKMNNAAFEELYKNFDENKVLIAEIQRIFASMEAALNGVRNAGSVTTFIEGTITWRLNTQRTEHADEIKEMMKRVEQILLDIEASASGLITKFHDLNANETKKVNQPEKTIDQKLKQKFLEHKKMKQRSKPKTPNYLRNTISSQNKRSSRCCPLFLS